MARDQRLNVEITADDRASAKIDAAARKVENLDGEQATARIDADASGFNSVVDALDDKLGGALAALRGAAGPGGSVAALGGALLYAADEAANLAIEADNTARLTGDSVEEASRLSGIWRQAGFDNKDLQDVLLQMNGVLTTNKDLAGQLGINLEDGRSIGERFQQVIQILGSEFTDAGERSQIASQLFGEEGVRQVNAVEGAFGDLSRAVDDYSGNVFTPADVQKARDYKRAVADVKTEFSSLASEVGIEVLPELTSVLEVLTETKRKADELGASDFAEQFINPWGGAKEVLGDVGDILKDEIEPNLVDIGRAAIDDALAGITSMDGGAERASTRMERLGRDGEAAMDDIEDGADDASAAVDGVKSSFQNLRSEISNRSAYRDLETAFADVKTAAVDAYSAASQGTADAAQKARDYEGDVDELRLQTLDYIEAIGGVPLQRTTQIMAAIDAGDFAEAERLLGLLERERVVRVRVEQPGVNIGLGRVYGAEGGVVNRPTIAMLGEAGPEAVVPLHKVPGNQPIESILGTGSHVESGSHATSEGPVALAGPTYVLQVAPGAIVMNGSNISGDDVIRSLDSYVRRGGFVPADVRRRFSA